MESAKISQQQIALFIFDDISDAQIVNLPDLKQFNRIIVSSRHGANKFIQQIQERHIVVEFIPLDLDQTFQKAKQRHLDAMIQFRRWFNDRQPRSLHWMWWFTQTSFRHSFFDRIFNLYLCYELQIKLKHQYPDQLLICHLYSDNRMAEEVQWPVATRLVSNSKTNWGRICQVFGQGFEWIEKSLIRLWKNSISKQKFASKADDADVCLISGCLPVCWEKKGDRIRDRYYSELPEFLKIRGLKVWQLIAPGRRCSLLSDQREPRSIRWDLSSILHAFVQTLVYYLMTAFVTVRNRKHLGRSWPLKLFARTLLSNSKNFFGNLACYYSYKRLFSEHHPRIVLFYDEVYFSGRALNMAIEKLPFNQRPITVGMQHGSVSENQLTYFTDVGDADLPFPNCDYFFVHNELAKISYGRFLHQNSINQIKITGLHRVELKHFSGLIKPEDMLAGLDKHQPVFLLIGGIPTDIKELCHALIQLMHNTPLQLIIKPHPSHPFSEDRLADLREANSGHIWYSEEFNLDEVISKGDYIITTVSTSLLNVITHRKYPIIYNSSERFDASQMLWWFKQQEDAVVVHSPAVFHKIIKRLAGIKPKRPAQFSNKNIIMPPVVGRNSMNKIYSELDHILTTRGSNGRTKT